MTHSSELSLLTDTSTSALEASQQAHEEISSRIPSSAAVLNQDWALELITQPRNLINQSDPKIKEDILRIILQYLQDEGYYSAAMTLMASGFP
ncbi:hypothetical protein HDV03_003363 [Kappamyces sp. JEL0829]|nr:hypothetical protein HDV03_003363 [Kappamyces sp. JEL0829]KAJ3363746.1 hypothetical protein HDU91_002880 [Kappamyces sp. JEL0680]